MMRLVITRNQYEKLKEIFDQYDIDQVVWTEENLSGIGPTITVEYKDKTVDLTDVESW